VGDSAASILRFLDRAFERIEMPFPLLAQALEKADASIWQPAADPDTHWSHWFPK
jgi:hypothetical protein